jgi:hypothetical protein
VICYEAADLDYLVAFGVEACHLGGFFVSGVLLRWGWMGRLVSGIEIERTSQSIQTKGSVERVRDMVARRVGVDWGAVDELRFWCLAGCRTWWRKLPVGATRAVDNAREQRLAQLLNMSRL